MTMKYETVCIKRQGFSLLHTEGADFAAKVTYHGWIEAPRGQVWAYEVVSEMLIPRLGYWGE